MRCKLTDIEGEGVKAHIIPKSFYSIDPQERQPIRLLTNIEGQYPKRCPTGIYDETIVVEEGERIFSEWDNYGAELLLDNKGKFLPVFRGGKVIAFKIDNYDYEKLKLFFLSVLWRASVSSHYFFRKVNLGPFEKKLKQSLLEKDPGDTDWISVSIAKWSDRPEGAGMMDPFRTKFFDINYYVMYLEHYIVYFKMDGRKAGQPMNSTQLKPDSELILVSRELQASKELNVMLNLINANKK